MKYKKGAIVAEESGTHQKWCTLIRKDKKSPWLDGVLRPETWNIFLNN